MTKPEEKLMNCRLICKPGSTEILFVHLACIPELTWHILIHDVPSPAIIENPKCHYCGLDIEPLED